MVDDTAMKTLSQHIACYGNNRMATALKISPQAVSKWSKQGKLPPRRARAVAELLGLTPQSICPEVFGPSALDPAKDAPSTAVESQP